MTLRAATHVLVAVLSRPSLWPTALRQWWRSVPEGWWRRRPFLPLPTREYVQFRLVTQYGRIDGAAQSEDVLNYLVWCKHQNHAA